ncbi:unnamed protein product [Rhizoctonia solani]|uniref:F-box domain-containing protein n=1 Tax=Rhizoctonia solani TaxID=456999 RepID=A0A8H3E9L9_9AGAM|nr:unnamed protein product [Rhizoctonia solani]
MASIHHVASGHGLLGVSFAFISTISTRTQSIRGEMPHQLLGFNPPPLLKLSDDILSNIFMDIVFEHTNSETSWSLSTPFVGQDVRTIYRRIYCLLSVCRYWRAIALATGALWSVIPMIVIVNPSEGQQPFQLSLQRAGGSNLHLAVTKQISMFSILTETLAKYGPRFSTIDLRAYSINEIRKAIEALLQHGTPRTLSELSLSNKLHFQHDPHNDGGYITARESPLNTSFATLLGLLSILRLHGTNVHWNTTRFSSRLVELHIEEITLGSDAALAPFLKAISSASELRDLKIISVITIRDAHAPPDTIAGALPPPVILPKLRSLLLVGLYFNTLRILLPAIAPSSCGVSLVLGNRGLMTCERFIHHDHNRSIREKRADIFKVSDLLERSPIDTLTLFGRQLTGQCLTGALLHHLPTLKTLYIDSCLINWVVCSRIAQPFNPLVAQGGFSTLDVLCITRSSIHVDAFDEFKDVAISYREVILAGVYIVDPDKKDKQPLPEDHRLVKWLVANIPVVRMVDHGFGSPKDNDKWSQW